MSGKTYIAMLTHWYHPPTQHPAVIQEITETCYAPITNLLRCLHLFLSVDMPRSLGEKLPEEIIRTLRSHHLNGFVELINTSAYHYFLPLVPEPIIAQQLRLNQMFYQEHFGAADVPGIFPPELGVCQSLYGAMRNLGYSWLIADDELFGLQHLHLPEHERVPQDRIPMLDGCGILLRSRMWSNIISRMKYPDGHKVTSGNQLLRDLLQGQEQWRNDCRNRGDSYVIIALDVETFGHHHKGTVECVLIPFLEEVNRHSERCAVVPLNAIFQKFQKIPINRNEMLYGSWSTDKADIDRGIFFPLWNHPDNPYHRAWNRFKDETFGQIAFPNQNAELQTLLNTAFYSCSPWWATKDNPKDRTIAGWCLPMFKRIMELAPLETSQTLSFYYRAMNDFIEQS